MQQVDKEIDQFNTKYEKLTGESREDMLKGIDIGRKVYVKFPQPKGACSKLFQEWRGGFVVDKRTGDNTYRLKRIGDTSKRRYRVHSERIRLVPLNEGSVMEQKSVATDDREKTTVNPYGESIVEKIRKADRPTASEGADSRTDKVEASSKAVKAEASAKRQTWLRSGRVKR